MLSMSLSTSLSLDHPSTIDADFISGGYDQISGWYVVVFARPSYAQTYACGDAEGHWLLTSPSLIDIPGGTAVPHWTYLNVTGSDTWDAVAARAVVSQCSAYFPEVPLHQS